MREVTGSSSAFAALRNDGSVIAWGKPACGGDTGEVDEELKDVLQIHSSWGAFAAILEDRTVVCWGDPDKGGDSRLERWAGFMLEHFESEDLE